MQKKKTDCHRQTLRDFLMRRRITARTVLENITMPFVVLEFILLIGEFIFAPQSKLNREFLRQMEHFRVTSFY